MGFARRFLDVYHPRPRRVVLGRGDEIVGQYGNYGLCEHGHRKGGCTLCESANAAPSWKSSWTLEKVWGVLGAIFLFYTLVVVIWLVAIDGSGESGCFDDPACYDGFDDPAFRRGP